MRSFWRGFEEQTYHTILARLSTWVKRPTEEELFDSIEEQQKQEERHLAHTLQVLQRTLNLLTQRDKEPAEIRSRSPNLLGKPLALHPSPGW